MAEEWAFAALWFISAGGRLKEISTAVERFLLLILMLATLAAASASAFVKAASDFVIVLGPIWAGLAATRL